MSQLWIRMPVPGKRRVQTDLYQLHRGEDREKCVTDYYRGKLRTTVMIWLAGILFAVAAGYTGSISAEAWKILLGAFAVGIALFFLKDKDLHDLVEKRRQEERHLYPEIVQKLTLYLGAGLNLRTAFVRVAQDYEDSVRRGGGTKPAYEEMLVAVREIGTGVSETLAYENFGRRTGVREYIRLSTFLTQNLKKGSSTLLQQLREEAEAAEELQMQNARRLSEEASTKLLLPMVMLLLVVMIMIMLPAFSNVGV